VNEAQQVRVHGRELALNQHLLVEDRHGVLQQLHSLRFSQSFQDFLAKFFEVVDGQLVQISLEGRAELLFGVAGTRWPALCKENHREGHGENPRSIYLSGWRGWLLFIFWFFLVGLLFGGIGRLATAASTVIVFEPELGLGDILANILSRLCRRRLSNIN